MSRYDFLGTMEVILVNFAHELAQIITTYDFLSATQAILSNVRTDFNLTKFLFGKLE